VFQIGLLRGHLHCPSANYLSPEHSHFFVVGLIDCGGAQLHSQIFEVGFNLVPVGHVLHILVTGSKNFPVFSSHQTQ